MERGHAELPCLQPHVGQLDAKPGGSSRAVERSEEGVGIVAIGGVQGIIRVVPVGGIEEIVGRIAIRRIDGVARIKAVGRVEGIIRRIVTGGIEDIAVALVLLVEARSANARVMEKSSGTRRKKTIRMESLSKSEQPVNSAYSHA